MLIIHVLISIGFYFILMFLSVNFLGFLVRGLFTNPEIDKIKSKTEHEFIKQEIEKNQRTEKWTNVVALLLVAIYYYVLIHFWNVGVAIVALMLMAGRLPDLIWEIKMGKKITVGIARAMPKNALYFITILFDLAALPVLYYFLYHF